MKSSSENKIHIDLLKNKVQQESICQTNLQIPNNNTSVVLKRKMRPFLFLLNKTFLSDQTFSLTKRKADRKSRFIDMASIFH